MSTIRPLQFRGSLGAGAPVIGGVAPSSGDTAGGTSVVITGSNFIGTTAVTIGGIAAASFNVDGPTQITAVTAAHSAGVIDIAVTNAFGTGTGTGVFTYAVPSSPTISSIIPGSGDPAGGAPVVITGTNLGSATSVTFGGVAGTITANTPTSITVTAPAHSAGSVSVVVTTGAGSASTTFVYAATGTPLLYRIVSPEYPAGNPGFEVEMVNTFGVGTVIELQIRTAGAPDWSSPLRDVTHTVTSGEDTFNNASLSFTALPVGSYEARVLVNGVASNILTVSV